MKKPKRNTSLRNIQRARLRHAKLPCGICGEEIIYDLPFDDPKAFQLDHIVPIALGGSEKQSNTQASHRNCNRSKGHKLYADVIKRSGSLKRPNQN